MDERLHQFLDEHKEDSWQWHLALHSAFPIAFTADLLFKLLVNFPLEKDGKPLTLKNHHLIVSDLILSPLCFDIGQGIFEFHPEIREVLHDELTQKHRRSIFKLANFLRFYIEENPTKSPTEVYRNVQRFEAAKIIDQNQAASFILSGLKNQRNQNKDYLKGIEIQLKKAKKLRNKIGGKQGQDLLLLEQVEELVKSLQQVIDGDTEAAKATIERLGLSEGKKKGSFETAVPREVLEWLVESFNSKKEKDQLVLKDINFLKLRLTQKVIHLNAPLNINFNALPEDIRLFRENVQQELQGIEHEEEVKFVWRTIIRALPFLGHEGNFNFMGKENVQKLLYDVFCSLDSCVISGSSYSDIFDLTAFICHVGARLDVDLKSIILEDIDCLKSNKQQVISKSTYGILWSNFQAALSVEDCDYWGDLYESIFENNFAIDEFALEQRMSLPQEIRERGASTVAQYLEELEKNGSQPLNEARIIILGDKGVGKTCLARRLINPYAPMTTPEESTAGVDANLLKLYDENTNVRVWDFSGHVVTHAIHRLFLSERCLYIIVYDDRSENHKRLVYWLDTVKNYGDSSQVLILVNKRDTHEVHIPINALKDDYSIAGFYSFNLSKDIVALTEFRKEVIDFVKNNPAWKHNSFPTSYYQVKREIEHRFAKGKEFILMAEFLGIAQEYGIRDSKQMLNAFHALGVCLWYEDIGKDFILSSNWVSQGVYSIINWANNQRKPFVSLNDFSKVFEYNKIRFPKVQHYFLFNLIKVYELGYETEDKRLIIPHLLNEDRPEILPYFSEKSLVLKYEADRTLPPNIIPRLIVRHHQQIKKLDKQAIIWRYGVVLEDGKGALALVEDKGTKLRVSVRGTNKTEFLSTLRNTLNDIFSSFRETRPLLSYRIYMDTVPKNALYLPEDQIVTLFERNRYYYDYRTNRDIPMRPIVINYNIPIKVAAYNKGHTPEMLLIQGATYHRGGYLHIPLVPENYPKLLGQKLAISVSWTINFGFEEKMEANTVINANLIEEFRRGGIRYLLIIDPEAHSRELPVHEIIVDNFAIGKYPVTFAQYDAFCEATKRKPLEDRGWGRGQRPVMNVSWYDAIAYCNWLSDLWGYECVYKRTGKEVDINYKADGYRLPTEAEWEYAARGGKESKGFLYSGSDNLDEVGWYNNNSGDKTHEVGQKKPNELGLYDMSGNVWEWCNDWGSYKSYKKLNVSKNSNVWGLQDGSRRVGRGGGWNSPSRHCSITFRHWRGPSVSRGILGFRIARSSGGTSS